jgi:mxaA protein
MRLIMLLTLMVCAVCEAQAGVHTVSVTEPRPFGYFIGDTIERRAEITVDAGDELVEASLPRPGPLTYWLDLNRIDVSEVEQDSGKRYRLDLTYQTFYAPLEAKSVMIPTVTLRFRAVTGSTDARLPSFTIAMAPIRELFPEKNGATPVTLLRPDTTPRSVLTGPVRTVLAVSATTAAITFLLLARHLAWWPFRRRPGRPFTEAARSIAALRKRNDTTQYRYGLLSLHRAFDSAAGHRLLAEDLPRFLAEHAELIQDRAEVERFFESSRRIFFADDPNGARAAMPLDALAALSASLAAREQALQ